MSAGSFVAAPLVLSAKPPGTLDVNLPNGHSWTDIFYGDDTGNSDCLDFSKVQQFFFTIALVLVYAVGLGSILIAASTVSWNRKLTGTDISGARRWLHWHHGR